MNASRTNRPQLPPQISQQIEQAANRYSALEDSIERTLNKEVKLVLEKLEAQKSTLEESKQREGTSEEEGVKKDLEQIEQCIACMTEVKKLYESIGNSTKSIKDKLKQLIEESKKNNN